MLIFIIFCIIVGIFLLIICYYGKKGSVFFQDNADIPFLHPNGGASMPGPIRGPQNLPHPTSRANQPKIPLVGTLEPPVKKPKEVKVSFGDPGLPSKKK